MDQAFPLQLLHPFSYQKLDSEAELGHILIGGSRLQLGRIQIIAATGFTITNLCPCMGCTLNLSWVVTDHDLWLSCSTSFITKQNLLVQVHLHVTTRTNWGI